MRFLKSKKGALGGIPAAVMTFGVIAIVLVVISLVLTNLGEDQTANSAAANATTHGLEATGNISEQLPLMGLIIAFGVVIAIVLAYFAFRGRGGGL